MGRLTEAGEDGINHQMGGNDREADMTAIVSAMSRALLSIAGVDVLKHFMFFCGAVILVFVLSLTYGLDLSSGLF